MSKQVLKLKWRVQRLTQPIARGSASFKQTRTFFGHNPVEHRASSNRTTTTAKFNRLLHQHAISHLNENPANLRLTATRQNRRGAPSSSHRAPEFAPPPHPHPPRKPQQNQSETKAKPTRNSTSPILIHFATCPSSTSLTSAPTSKTPPRRVSA